MLRLRLLTTCNRTVKQHFWLFVVYVIIHVHRVVLVINNASCRPFGRQRTFSVIYHRETDRQTEIQT